MQGQSPYMVNVSFLYTEQSTGTSVNLLYNVYGRRMNAVGFLASDIYEEPREIVDLSASQPILAGLELKASVKNLNNSRSTLTRDGILYERSISGRTYSLQLSKTF
jgi:outer membrane receptor protein involved in Fe transport